MHFVLHIKACMAASCPGLCADMPSECQLLLGHYATVADTEQGCIAHVSKLTMRSKHILQHVHKCTLLCTVTAEKIRYMICSCGTSAFRSSSSDWKRKATADAQTLNEYAELFGSDQAAATEAAEAGHPASNGDMADSHGDVAASEAAVMADMDSTEQPAKKRKKGSKATAAAAAAEVDSAVVADQMVPTEDRQAVIKDKRKKKQAKKQEEDLAEPTSVLGTDLADAPWANEIVSPVLNTEAAEQPNGAAVKKKQKKSKRKEGENGKGVQKQDVGVTIPQDAKEALALLGFAAAQPASKQKKKQAAKKA